MTVNFPPVEGCPKGGVVARTLLPCYNRVSAQSQGGLGQGVPKVAQLECEARPMNPPKRHHAQ